LFVSPRLSPIGYALIMIFFLCYAFNCILHSLVIQLTLFSSFILITPPTYVDYSINLLFGNHSIATVLNLSIGLRLLSHSIGSMEMPVTTRSKASLSHLTHTMVSLLLPIYDVNDHSSSLFVVDKGKGLTTSSSSVVQNVDTCSCSQF
jgi:hypothetical protein